MITRYIKTNKLKEEFAIIKNKYFSIERSELHETICGKKFQYEKLFLKEVPLVKLSKNYNKDCEIILISSVNSCLTVPYIGQKSYDIIIDGKIKTIVGYHIDKVLNGI